MTQFFAVTGVIALIVLMTVLVAEILFLICKKVDTTKRKKRRHHNTANLVIGDYFKVGAVAYECVDFEYYRGLVYVHGKPLEESNHQIDATDRFDDNLLTDDRRLVSIFDFGDITEILGEPTIK